MSLLSKIRETLLCLEAGKVTLPYPPLGQATAANFRGRPVFDAGRCVGCGGCANNCPARAILIFDVCQELRVLHYAGRRCTYCGRCAEVCPEKAITMSPEFETATDYSGDAQQQLQIFMSTCQRCGRCFKDASALEKLKMTGYRFDDLANERWVYGARAYKEEEAAVKDIAIEMDW